MDSFFNKSLELTQKELVSKIVCSKHVDVSRSYEKGKGFYCSEFQLGENYYNNDFLQSFVIYKNNLYACVKDTSDVPENSKNWILVLHSSDILGATATVDSNVGVPNVEVTMEGEGPDKTFHFHFKNVKGDKGDQGPQGEQGKQGEIGPQGPAAVIESVTTEYVENGEDPSVEVKTSGTSQNRNFKFIFNNLKGPKGESGSGNFEIGDGNPSKTGYTNDVYLNISSGIFYVYNKGWKEKGKISTGSSAKLLWQDD